MRAAQLVAPRQWELIEIDKPQPAVGQMLVRLERVAVCGSDQPPFSGMHEHYPQSPGDTGHEGLGLVETCPSGHYREGERVLLWGFDRGLFQEYVLARDEGGCIRLPTDLPEEKALMSQLLGTVIHSFYKLGNIIDQDVVVLGQGPVGLLFDAVLRNLGARRIIAIDKLAYRLEVGRQMGATHVVDSAAQDPVAAVAEITGGAMADLVVEAVGITQTLNLVPALARRNGQAICFGVPNKDHREGLLSIKMLDMLRQELRLTFSVGPNPDRDYRPALDWIVQGRIDPTPIISHVLPFDQIQQAFTMAFDDPEPQQALKIVLKFP
jgi:threonine dehydrogenase-like Zn-dependent dehydrogenase